MPMPQQQRSPRPDVVDVLVPVHVEYVRALSASNEYGVATHAAERAHRRVDATGDHGLGAPEQFLGFYTRHVRLPPGTSRLKPKLMATSNKLPWRFCSKRLFRPRYDCVPANRSCIRVENR